MVSDKNLTVEGTVCIVGVEGADSVNANIISINIIRLVPPSVNNPADFIRNKIRCQRYQRQLHQLVRHHHHRRLLLKGAISLYGWL